MRHGDQILLWCNRCKDITEQTTGSSTTSFCSCGHRNTPQIKKVMEQMNLHAQIAKRARIEYPEFNTI